jgi:hypothetical protein
MSLPSKSLTINAYHVIRNLFTKHSHSQIKLGRWGVNTANKIGLITDYSNEDHCGTCAEYISKKVPEYTSNDIEDNLLYEFESLLINTPTIKKSNKYLKT